MKTPSAIARNTVRLAVLVAMTAPVLGVGPARGAPSGPARTVRQIVAVPANDPPAPAARGLATTGSGSAGQSRAGLPTVNAVTRSCPGSDRTATRLGLMQHTALYSHCDYP